jgi:hypothetical protein
MILGDENTGASEQVYPTAVPSQRSPRRKRAAAKRFAESARAEAEKDDSVASQVASTPSETLIDQGPEEPEPAVPRVPGWNQAPEGLGICLSGGGIRSASFCLGALQSLTKAGLLLDNARYLSSVSGGSYIATAITMIAQGKVDGESDDDVHPTVTPPGNAQPNQRDLRPFAHGTPEEQYLRNRTLYLTHGKAGIPGVVWRVFLGVFLNLLIAALSIAMIFGVLGWFYAWRWPSLKAGCPTNCPIGPVFAIPLGVWIAIAVVGGLAILIGCLWLTVRFKADGWRVGFGMVSGVCVVAAMILLVFAAAIPWIIHLARPYYLTFPPPPAAHATRSTTVAVTSVGLLAVFGGWIAAARRLVSSSNALEKEVLTTAEAGVKKYRSFFINLAATIAGPLLVLAGIVTATYWGSAYLPGFSGAGLVELGVWVIIVVVWLFIWNFADVTAWSLYPMYRSRLSAGFVLRRFQRAQGDPPSPTSLGDLDADARPYGQQYWLSDFEPIGFPEVIICAAANIRNYGATPSGSHVSSFTFTSKSIGGPIVGAQPTETYEKQVGRGFTRSQTRFATLPTAMAISAAAISPSMGRMTRAPFRFFLALANLRLGVWVPNPRQLEKFEEHRKRRWYQPANYKLIPRPWYLVREMLGLNNLNARFLYVTDGGHYENLGLVELLRRKCETIWCIDASGDKVDTFSTLGGALQLAEAELQTDVRIDPQAKMSPQPAKGGRPPQFVKAPFCVGKIRYADGTTGTLIHVKAGVPTNAPLSIQAFAQQHPNFPCDSTLDQLYDADRFDAYRELGAFCVDQAVKGYPTAQRALDSQIAAKPTGPSKP